MDLTSNTLAELLNKIKLLGQVRSNFDPAILYAIGKQHRSLPLKERNWDKLADVVGYGCTTPISNTSKGAGDAYRQYILRGLKSFGEYKVPAEASEKTESEIYQEQYKDKTQIRDVYNAYRASLREDARIASFKEFIEECAQKQSQLPIRLDSTLDMCTDSNIEAILLLSDWHIGSDVANFYNTYDHDVAIKRVSAIVDKVKFYCRQNKVYRLNVLNLGDLIEGLIHVNGRINQQMDVCSQLIFATELMSVALNELQTAAPEVTYRSCSDNHSRMVADKNQSIESENLNRITDWWLAERLKNSSIKMKSDNLDQGFGKFKLLNGKNVVFFHGHQDSKSQTLQNVVGAVREWVDIVCCAHWHNPAEHTFQDMKLYVNGSLCGTCDYTLGRRLFTKPSQKLLIINKNDVADIDLSVY